MLGPLGPLLLLANAIQDGEHQSGASRPTTLGSVTLPTARHAPILALATAEDLPFPHTASETRAKKETGQEDGMDEQPVADSGYARSVGSL